MANPPHKPKAGRTAVITRAASGIGRACAFRLAQDGANIVPFGIIVNAIAPGITSGTSIHKTMPKYLDLIPQFQAIKRAGTPDDLASVVAFLNSDDAGFMTGQTVVVDGGAVRI